MPIASVLYLYPSICSASTRQSYSLQRPTLAPKKPSSCISRYGNRLTPNTQAGVATEAVAVAAANDLAVPRSRLGKFSDDK